MTGTITRGDGRGLAHAVVTVADQAGRQEALAATDPEGRYRIPLRGGGTYVVVAASGTFSPRAALVTVDGEAVSPSTDLMAGWLSARLGVKVRRTRAEQGTGMVAVRLERRSGPVELSRPDGRTATLRQPGQPDRLIALARRTVPDCLAEELRRLDPDDVYGEALAGVSQISRGRTSAHKSEGVR